MLAPTLLSREALCAPTRDNLKLRWRLEHSKWLWKVIMINRKNGVRPAQKGGDHESGWEMGRKNPGCRWPYRVGGVESQELERETRRRFLGFFFTASGCWLLRFPIPSAYSDWIGHREIRFEDRKASH